MFEYLDNLEGTKDLEKSKKYCKLVLENYNSRNYSDMAANASLALYSLIDYLYATQNVDQSAHINDYEYYTARDDSSFAKWIRSCEIDNKYVDFANNIRQARNTFFGHAKGADDVINDSNTGKQTTRRKKAEKLAKQGYEFSVINDTLCMTKNGADKCLKDLDSVLKVIAEHISPRIIFDTSMSRLPVLIAFDISGSMYGALDLSEEQRPINKLNAGISKMAGYFDDPKCRAKLDYSYLTFNNTVNTRRVFNLVSDIPANEKYCFKAKGKTSMNSAILESLDKIEEQKVFYKSQGLYDYNRPWLILITDGIATDTDMELKAQEKLQSAISGNHVIFYPINMAAGKGKETCKKKMMEYFPAGYKRENGVDLVIDGCDVEYDEIFQWLANSMKASANSDGKSNFGLNPAEIRGVNTKLF